MTKNKLCYELIQLIENYIPVIILVKVKVKSFKRKGKEKGKGGKIGDHVMVLDNKVKLDLSITPK